MQPTRARTALSRIERALLRVEDAVSRLDAAGADALADSQELARLRAAHAALRGKVGGAVEQIDRLLAKGEAG